MIRALAVCLAVVIPAAVPAQQATSQSAGELRILDKVTGEVSDMILRVGQPESSGLLTIQMNDCRVPADNPSGDAYAELTVSYRGQDEPAFQGWMIASAPALNAMDHPRYDVWIMRCTTS